MGLEMWRDQKFFILPDNAHPHTLQQSSCSFGPKKKGTVESPYIFARFKRARACIHIHTHTHRCDFSTKGGPEFSYTLLLREDHQYLNSQRLPCEVLTRMYVILTRSELLFIYKMIREIILISRADSGYPYNCMVIS